MAVKSEALAVNLARKTANKMQETVSIVRTRRKGRKYYLVLESKGWSAPKNSEFITSVSPSE